MRILVIADQHRDATGSILEEVEELRRLDSLLLLSKADDGKASLSTEPRSHGTVQVEVGCSDQEVWADVHNEGDGIAAEDQELAFERVENDGRAGVAFRIRLSRTREERG